MATESPEMEWRTSFARCLLRDSAAPQQVLSLETEGSLCRAQPRETEEKKKESSHCNNCSGSIIPTLEQIMLICVSRHLRRELLNVALPWIWSPVLAVQKATVYINVIHAVERKRDSAGVLHDNNLRKEALAGCGWWPRPMSLQVMKTFQIFYLNRP